MFTAAFWREAIERAIKTAAQSIATFFTIGEATNLYEMDWRLILSSAAVGAGYSVLTSIASAPLGRKESPSLVQGEPNLSTALKPNGGV